MSNGQEYRIKESIQLFKDWDDAELRNYFKIIHSYDEQGRRINLKNYKWQNEDWLLFDEVNHIYNDDGKLIECHITDFDKNQTWRFVNSFDNNGNLLEVKKIVGEDSSSGLLTYDQFGNLIEYHRKYQGKYFASHRKFNYKINGKYVHVTSKIHDNYGLQHRSWLYVRNNGINQLETCIRHYQIWGRSPYFTRFRSSLIDDFWDYEDEIFSRNYEDKSYQYIYFKEPLSFLYNPIHDGKIMQYSVHYQHDREINDLQVETWDFGKHIYEYNENGNLIQDRFVYKDSTIWATDSVSVYDWEIYSQNTYLYDEADNCTTIVFQLWDILNKTWIDRHKYFYTYEKFNNSNIISDKPGTKTDRGIIRFNLVNSPNPFNSSTTISFTLQKPAIGTLQIYDIRGKKVRTIFHKKELQKGEHNFVWEGTNYLGQSVASGIYFIRFQVNQKFHIKRCLLIR